MSYIRSGSNPEGLYIFGSDEDTICISHNIKSPLASYLDPSCSIVVPGTDFYKVCELYDSYNFDEDYAVRSGDIVVQERHIYFDTGELTSEEVDWERPGGFLIYFNFKDQFFYCWKVTWDYVVRNVVGRKP